MAKVLSRSSKTPLVEFDGGKITAVIRWAGAKSSVSIVTPQLNGLSRQQLSDFTAACNLMAKLVGSLQGKEVSLRGTKTDPDEPVQVEGQDCSVTYRLFPKDKTKQITFTRYAETGKVKAFLPSMIFSDLPSLVQVGYIANLAAGLMASYERI